MAIPKVFNKADEFRIEIVGRFGGPAVNEVAEQWQKALRENISRRYTVDISHMTGYDWSGRALLRSMHEHGTQVAAATRRSLDFLREITTRKLPSLTLPVTRNASGAKAPANAAQAKAFGS